MELKQETGILGKTLRQRLTEKGMDGIAIPAYLRNVTNMLASEHLLSLRELNSRLHLLGWDDVELDDYTLELLRAIFDTSVDSATPKWHDIILDNEQLDAMDDMRDSLLRLERGLFRDLYD